MDGLVVSVPAAGIAQILVLLEPHCLVERLAPEARLSLLCISDLPVAHGFSEFVLLRACCRLLGGYGRELAEAVLARAKAHREALPQVVLILIVAVKGDL